MQTNTSGRKNNNNINELLICNQDIPITTNKIENFEAEHFLEIANLLGEGENYKAGEILKWLLKKAENFPSLISIKEEKLEQSNYLYALKPFRKFLRLLSEKRDYNYWRGVALFGMDCFEESIEEFNTLLSIDSEHVDSYYHKALWLIKQKKYEEAL